MTFRPDADRWLSTAECARSIGVSDWWIRERITAGILPATAIRTGHRKVLKVRALGSTRVGGGKKTATAGPVAFERRETGGIRALRHCVERRVPSILRRTGSP